MAEERDDSSNSTYGVAYKIWKDVRGKYKTPETVEEDLELFLKCRNAVIRGVVR